MFVQMFDPDFKRKWIRIKTAIMKKKHIRKQENRQTDYKTGEKITLRLTNIQTTKNESLHRILILITRYFFICEFDI